VVLETTSHGLAQHRVTGCEYDVAVYTNVTHEHLDYHGSYENYLATKGLLIEHLSKTHNKPQGNPRYIVLNADDRSFEGLHPLVSHNWLAYSTQEKGDLNASEIQTHPASIDFTVNWHTQSLKVHCPMPGVFNVSNCLAALGATVGALGVDFVAAVNAIPSFTGIPGRMERIEMGQPFIAIVDFAHTPNALKVALETARPMTKGRVIAVFGSAGLRDVEKRKMMAAESVQLADMTILTAEDPRTESLDGILEEMALSASQHGGKENENFIREPDRGMAILKAVQMAGPEDLVIACGKGHEQSMCFGSVEYPWDDRTAMRAALAKVLQVYGPEMPKLPTSK
jgi:UDP-N-acetylmuramoyl-L-alanyl-D-glutamate--2,6-diaminopimelate ligase